MKIVNSFLIAGLMLHAAPAQATYPLSVQSKDYIKLAAVIGATIGGGCGLAAWASEDDAPRATIWQKIIKFSKFVLAPATIGAGIGAGIAYLTTHESNFASIEKTFAETEIKTDFELATSNGTAIDDFAKLNFDSKYPMHKSYQRLNSILSTIKSLKEKLPAIVNSGIDSIAPKAEELLKDLKSNETKLRDWIVQIKKDDGFTTESRLQTIEAAARRVADAINYNTFVNANRPHYHVHPRPALVVPVIRPKVPVYHYH